MKTLWKKIENTLNSGFFIKKANSFLEFSQHKLSQISHDSKFASNIDYIIMAVISLLIVSLSFGTTKLLGILALLAIALMVFKYFTQKGSKIRLTCFHIPILLYFAIAGISTTFSSLLIPSLKGFSKMAIYFGAFWVFYDVIKDKPKRTLYLLGLLALTTSIEAIYAIFQNFLGVEALATWQDHKNVNPEQLMNRVYGTLKPYNPNLLAGFLVAGFSSTLGMSVISLKNKKCLKGIIFGIGTIATLLAIVFTGSRGAYLATAAMLGTAFMISGHLIWHDYSNQRWLKRLWCWTLVLGLAGVITAIASSPSLQHRIFSIFAFRGDSSNSFRMNVYISSFKMFLDNWPIGIGPGNTTFRLIYGLYMTTGFDALGAYCVPLEIAIESGIFALFAFIGLILQSFIKSIKLIIAKCANISFETKIIAATCIIAITGMMTHGIVDTIWYRPQVQFIFWLIIATLATLTMNKIENNG